MVEAPDLTPDLPEPGPDEPFPTRAPATYGANRRPMLRLAVTGTFFTKAVGGRPVSSDVHY